jgi:hypothetical protein
MKSACRVLAATVLLCAGTQRALAQKSVLDTICPAAVAPLKVIYALPDLEDATKVSDAARNVVRVYESCMTKQLADGMREPGVNYAAVREAQFQVILGNALFKLQNYDDAHAAFAEAHRLSTLVVDWDPGNISRTVGKRQSEFHDDALNVQRSADVALARLEPVPKAKPTP